MAGLRRVRLFNEESQSVDSIKKHKVMEEEEVTYGQLRQRRVMEILLSLRSDHPNSPLLQSSDIATSLLFPTVIAKLICDYEIAEFGFFFIGGPENKSALHYLSPTVLLKEHESNPKASTAVVTNSIGRVGIACVRFGQKMVSLHGAHKGAVSRLMIDDIALEEPQRMEEGIVPHEFAKSRRFHIEKLDADRFMVMGGSGPDDYGYTKTCAIYHVRERTWSAAPCMHHGRLGFATVKVGRNIYVFGGYFAADTMTHCEVYDIDASKWTEIAPLPLSQGNGTAVFIPEDNCILVMSLYSKSVYEYRPATDSWHILDWGLPREAVFPDSATYDCKTRTLFVICPTSSNYIFARKQPFAETDWQHVPFALPAPCFDCFCI